MTFRMNELMRLFSPRSPYAEAGQHPKEASSFAQNLVAQTLARHGLSSAPFDASTVLKPADLHDTLARARRGVSQSPAAKPVIPDGAEFGEAQFTCRAGTRRYRIYVPASALTAASGLIVMLHGCTQTPEDFAAGTGMNVLADLHRFIVVYPHQSRGENAQSCWNWFRRADQRRDSGEPAILAGLAQKITADYGVPEGCTFVAGMSAGAAMAVILGETYPDVFSAVGAHSGLPAGCAKDVPSAFAAMAGNLTVETMPQPKTSTTRTIIFHGNADTTVHPTNAAQIARRAHDAGPRETAQSEGTGSVGGRHYRRKSTVMADGRAVVEEWQIDGLGHAWSGGSASGSYTDPTGPDASSEIVRFFFEQSKRQV